MFLQHWAGAKLSWERYRDTTYFIRLLSLRDKAKVIGNQGSHIITSKCIIYIFSWGHYVCTCRRTAEKYIHLQSFNNDTQTQLRKRHVCHVTTFFGETSLGVSRKLTPGLFSVRTGHVDLPHLSRRAVMARLCRKCSHYHVSFPALSGPAGWRAALIL